MSSRIYLPPWFDRETGEYYGPKSEAAYAKLVADHENWACRPQRPERPDAKLMHGYVFANHADVPASELTA